VSLSSYLIPAKLERISDDFFKFSFLTITRIVKYTCTPNMIKFLLMCSLFSFQSSCARIMKVLYAGRVPNYLAKNFAIIMSRSRGDNDYAIKQLSMVTCRRLMHTCMKRLSAGRVIISIIISIINAVGG